MEILPAACSVNGGSVLPDYLWRPNARENEQSWRRGWEGGKAVAACQLL